ncbi:MAG: monomeric [FeFe] hydrogenase [Mycoplasmataceae bacterium]|nr:monomeric [FeFe] hydrogenase [Mycoplasmataceae bacterium]
MRKFETDVQKLKHDILVEVIKAYDKKKMGSIYEDIPKIIAPGPEPIFRSTLESERQIARERIKIMLGGDSVKTHIVQTIPQACDECPAGGIYVTPFCRGCLGHRCKEACPREVITIVERKAVIDKKKCINCGACVKACPYQAIMNRTRPCIDACYVKAIKMDRDNKVTIDDSKCITCGNCVIKCPFAACVDRSFVIDMLRILDDKSHNTYAIVAPSIVGQFDYVDTEQLITGIVQLGFKKVVEVALGADAILKREFDEWKQKKVLTSSCCPSFKFFVKKNFPDLFKHVSDSPSPMIKTAELIKEKEPNAKVVFIGPCVAKKTEFQLTKNKGIVDCVVSFEELQALFDAREVHLHGIKSTSMNDASYYGRIFAKSGGILEGVKSFVTKENITNFDGVAMNGIRQCDAWLKAFKNNPKVKNFFEGMVCQGGCLNGPLSIWHNSKILPDVDKYGERANRKDPTSSEGMFKEKNA